MNNYDQLHNLNENDEELIVSINVPPENVQVEKVKKPTLSSILVSSLKAEHFKPMPKFSRREFAVPVPKYTLICFCVNVFILILLLVMQNFTDLLILIPLTLLFSVLAMPTLVLTFFIEFNTRRNIRVLNIIVIFLLGLFSYTFITSLCDNILVKFIYREYLDVFGRPIAWTITIYLVVFICANVLKVSKLPECMLISISFALGYAVAQAFFEGFNNLFIQTTIVVDNVKMNILTIINEPKDLQNSLNQLKASWFMTFVYQPLMLSSLAVIISQVVSQKELAKLNKRSMLKSLYLLVLLNMIIYFTSVVDTTFSLFNLILKAVSLFTAIGLSIKMIDYCLEKECP